MHRQIVIALALGAATAARADFKSDIGFTALQSEYGAALPSGSNIRVAQVEWTDGSNFWAPQAAGELAGKTINYFSTPSGYSGHANTVGQYFYGSNSIVPGISTVYSFEAIDYEYVSLATTGWGAPNPATATWEVENHSYSGTITAGIDIRGQRALDHRLRRDNVVATFSLNNATDALWGMYHQGYNGIVVGTETGVHSRGTTLYAAAGRTKPDIVGTATWTSYCAPTVASSAALIRAKGKSDANYTAADNALVVKALLLSGADKSPFPGWSHTDTQPLDAVWGAGRVHIGNSYRTLLAGRGQASTSSLVGGSGWDAGTAAAGSKWYYFQVPAGSSVPFSAALTWFAVPNLDTMDVSLTNLDLKLWSATASFTTSSLVARSVSTIDNVEHIYVASLAPGYYALEVTSPSAGESYGLAWKGSNNAGGTPAATAPSITTQPSSQSVTAGANVTFSVTATGTATLTYQWKKDGANVAGATGSSLSLTNVTSGNAGNYTVVVTNAAGSATSNAATLTVNAAAVAPGITTQPASQTVTAGANVTFSVAATGTAPMTYQWRKDGTDLSGATGSSLSLTNVTSGNAGSYTVVVTNAAGYGISQAATLTVNAAAVAPSITTQPTSQSVTSGGNVTFSVTATGTATLTYQWKKDGSNIAGATSASLSLTNVTSGNAGNYTVVVTNAAGSATSNAATLTIAAAGSAPAITSQPSSQTVNAGANVTFSVTADGTGPMTYQWRKDGSDLSGATSSSLSLTNVSAANAGSYTVVVTNVAGFGISQAATLTVNAVVAPSITTHPVSQTITSGGNVTFSVTASGTATLTYQWKKDGANVAGATSSSLSLTNVTSGNAGNYTVVVTNAAGSATSNAATLTITAAAVAPSITTQPSSQTVTAGANVTFSVTASGTATLTYQWKKDGANVAGATSSSLSLTNVTSGSAGNYTVVVTNAAGSATSNAATLTVNAAATAPAITSQPLSRSVTVGASVSFTVTATGTGTLTYQWKKNGANIAGATASTYTIGAAALNDAADYTAVVSNVAGSGTSQAATLTVAAAAVAPSILTQPLAQTAAFGGSVTFTVSATGTGTLTYQWRKNGAAISGQTGATLVLYGLKGSDAATYDVVVSNEAGSVTSTGVALTLSSNKQLLRALATRAVVGSGGDILITGIVIDGNQPKRLLVRAVGPTLASYGVEGTIAQPVLSVYSGQTEIARNQGWTSNSNVQEIRTAAASVGAAALQENSQDSALLYSFDPGIYTVQVRGATGAGGVALIEMYDVDAGGTAKFKALSSRAMVGTGSNILIPSLVVDGAGTKTVLVRAVGPGLRQFGLDGVLATPRLEVHKMGVDAPIASNQGWSNNTDPAAIAGVAATVGAFSLEAGSADCAMLLTLEQGAYTFHVSGVGDTTGIALVELYEL